MPKYYVRSGHLERIVTADAPREAAYLALERGKGEEIDEHFFYVDERGFRGPTPKDECIHSDFIPLHIFSAKEIYYTTGEDGGMEFDEDNTD